MNLDYPPSLPDEQVLAIAQQEQRILITEDRDFGEIVFRRRLPHSGVLYLRLPPMEVEAKIGRLQALLDRYDDHLNQFILVPESAVRVRTSTWLWKKDPYRAQSPTPTLCRRTSPRAGN